MEISTQNVKSAAMGFVERCAKLGTMEFAFLCLRALVTSLEGKIDRLWAEMPPIPADRLSALVDGLTSETEERVWDLLGDGDWGDA